MEHYLNNIFRRNRAPSFCFRSCVVSSFSRINSADQKKKNKRERKEKRGKKQKANRKIAVGNFLESKSRGNFGLKANLFKQSYPVASFKATFLFPFALDFLNYQHANTKNTLLLKEIICCVLEKRKENRIAREAR